MRGVGLTWQSAGVKQKLLSSERPRWHRSPEEIRLLLAQHAQSGLSLLAFARAHDLCYASLRRWRSTQASAINTRMDAAEAHRRRATPAFVPVQLEDAGPGGEFTLCWPGGRSLRIPAGFDPGQLQRLLAVLEART